MAGPLNAQADDPANLGGGSTGSSSSSGAAIPGNLNTLESWALAFTAGSSTCGSNNDQTIGWRFDLAAPVLVTRMAWWDGDGAGLPISHEVGIWDPAGTLIANTHVTIPAGTVATLDGVWRVVPITPVWLPAAAGYIVGGYNGVNAAQCLNEDATQTVASVLTYRNAMYGGASFSNPTNVSVATNGFYGVNFAFQNANASTIPALSTAGFVVLAMALAAVGVLLFRRLV